jgi:hypothetical protein
VTGKHFGNGKHCENGNEKNVHYDDGYDGI